MRTNEKGSIAISSAIFAAALIGLILALISHGQFSNGYTRTREAAANTARVSSQEVDLNNLLTGGNRGLNKSAAADAAYSHISNYPNLRITKLVVDDGVVEVTVSETITSISGITKTISSEASASPISDR